MTGSDTELQLHQHEASVSPSWVYRPGWGGTIVPKRYFKSSGLATTNLRVRRVERGPFQFLRHPQGEAIQIAPAALCVLAASSGETTVLVDIRRFPRLAEALLLLGGISGGEHRKRYLTLYQAYECLERNPHVELAAIRNGLSHPASVLAYPTTVAALTSLFGSTAIDLTLSRHVRVLYRHFGRLVVEVDALIHDAIVTNLPALRRLASARDVLWDGEVYGIHGFTPPIPIRAIEEAEGEGIEGGPARRPTRR